MIGLNFYTEACEYWFSAAHVDGLIARLQFDILICCIIIAIVLAYYIFYIIFCLRKIKKCNGYETIDNPVLFTFAIISMIILIITVIFLFIGNYEYTWLQNDQEGYLLHYWYQHLKEIM